MNSNRVFEIADFFVNPFHRVISGESGSFCLCHNKKLTPVCPQLLFWLFRKKHELRQSILKLATFCVDPFGQVITGESGGGTSIVDDKTTDFDDVGQQQQKSFNSGSDFIFIFILVSNNSKHINSIKFTIFIFHQAKMSH